MSCIGQGKGIPSKHLVTLLVLRGTVLIYFWLRSLRILTVVLLFSQDFDFRVIVLSWFWLLCYCSLMILTVILLFSHDFDCRVTVLSGFWLSCYCSLRVTVVLLFSHDFDRYGTVPSIFWLLLYSSRRFWLLCSLKSFISMIQFSQEFCYCSYWCLEMVKNIKSF
jgi:hypothetical protein